MKAKNYNRIFIWGRAVRPHYFFDIYELNLVKIVRKLLDKKTFL